MQARFCGAIDLGDREKEEGGWEREKKERERERESEKVSERKSNSDFFGLLTFT